MYEFGACLSIFDGNKYFIGCVVTGFYKRNYDLSLIDFFNTIPPNLSDFKSGNIFGTKDGGMDFFKYNIYRCIFPKRKLDASGNVKKIGVLPISNDLTIGDYQYFETVDELFSFYLQEIEVRREKTKNALRFPEIGFCGRHLIPVSEILNTGGNNLSV